VYGDIVSRVKSQLELSGVIYNIDANHEMGSCFVILVQKLDEIGGSLGKRL